MSFSASFLPAISAATATVNARRHFIKYVYYPQ